MSRPPRSTRPAHLCRFAVRSRPSSLEAFLGGTASIPTAWGRPRALHSPLSVTIRRICLPDLPTGLEDHRSRDLAPRVPPSLHPALPPETLVRGTGILTRCPSPAPRGLGLGPPHPPLISMAAEPSGMRWGGFAPPSRYSCRHSHSPPLHGPSRVRFTADGDAPLPSPERVRQSAASVAGLSPGGLSAPRHIRARTRGSTSELLRTL